MSSGYACFACFAQRADASDVYFTPQGAQQGHYQPSVPDLLTNPRALRGAVSFVRLAQHEANGQLAKAAKAFNGISSLGMSNPAQTSAPAEAATSGGAAADGSAQAAAAAAAAAQGQGAPHATTGLTSAMSAADGQEDEAADSEDGSAYALDDDVTTDATTDDGWFS